MGISLHKLLSCSLPLILLNYFTLLARIQHALVEPPRTTKRAMPFNYVSQAPTLAGRSYQSHFKAPLVNEKIMINKNTKKKEKVKE